MQNDLENHPDLKDEGWVRAANRRAQREIRRQRRQARMRRHGGKVVSAVALIVIGAVLVGLYQAGRFGEVSLPEVKLPQTGVNLEIPFAGTPAEQWPEGEKGIVVPDANPIYEQVRQALIASRMDPVMLTEHKPDRFLAMLAPEVRDHVAKEISGWTTRLKQGTKLLPNGVRVSGKMTLGEQDGYPAVVTDYVFAYAFEPPDPKKLLDQMEIVAAIREKVTYVITPEGLWPADSDGFQYSIACQAAKDGFLAPQFTEPAKQDEGLPGDDRKYFSVDGQMPTENTCD
ncbi:hypothetical protein [Lentzea flava]|uniref:Uncharacterized protein n=1 Tax=Lentzea flava TaxID=103732 RepID=A0ABQ2VAE7_9PSEU|nr:hypothetical protein [Lentzea flava]MCP2204274.1 hypothetical protein [Lentzea flava]GGU75973.1 hypothetical protein GCM10010178_79110 [Lentzea flava]